MRIATRYRIRPSDVIAEPDDYAAFCFDEAIEYYASCIEAGRHPYETAADLADPNRALIDELRNQRKRQG